MGLLRESREPVDEYEPSDSILLVDEQLMQRIDECHSGEFVRENHPDRCPGCGNIEPGFRHCRRCGHRLKRKGKDAGFCFQEVAGVAEHQDALDRLASRAEREEDGGVHEWVTAVLVPALANDKDAMAVQIRVMQEPVAEMVGSIPQDDAAAIYKALTQVYKAHEKSVACLGLIQGGVRRQNGSSSSYGIRLLLPHPGDIAKAAKVALAAK